MLNFVNVNDVYPILELIQREIRKYHFDSTRPSLYSTSPYPMDSDDVVSVELVRGSDYDPNLITSVVITYYSGTEEIINLHRGVDPPVPPTVENHEYINNVLITGATITRIPPPDFGEQIVIYAELIRKDGYGPVEKINFSYIDEPDGGGV